MGAALLLLRSPLGIAAVGLMLVLLVGGVQQARVRWYQAQAASMQTAYEREASLARLQRRETQKAAAANVTLQAWITQQNTQIYALAAARDAAAERANASARVLVRAGTARRAARAAGTGPVYLRARLQEIVDATR